MSENSTKKPLKEVWLVHNRVDDTANIKHRVLATLGQKEIKKVAIDIAKNFDRSDEVYDEVIDIIYKALEKGETQININPSKDNFYDDEFYIYKVAIDSGINWADTDTTYKPTEEEKTDVFIGSTIYATLDYYDNVDALYSTELFEDMCSFDVE